MGIKSKITTGIMALLISNLAFAAPSDDAMNRGLTEYNKGNFTEAKALWEWSAEQGNTGAMYGLGNLYANGQGVQLDTGKAMFNYNRAANAGNSKALFTLGVIYNNGLNNQQLNKNKAKQYFQQACNKGYQDACALSK